MNFPVITCLYFHYSYPKHCLWGFISIAPIIWTIFLHLFNYTCWPTTRSLKLGLYGILIWPDTGYPAWPDTGWIVKEEFFSIKFLRENFSFQKSIYDRNFNLILYSVKRFQTSLLFRSSHRLLNSLTGYPANETGYPGVYRISKKTGYPASRISGTTLLKMCSSR